MYHALSYVFIIFWFSILSVIFIISLADSIIFWEFNFSILIAALMFLVNYGIIQLLFSEEVKTMKRFFYKKWYIRLE